jgi:hypothetical protein
MKINREKLSVITDAGEEIHIGIITFPALINRLRKYKLVSKERKACLVFNESTKDFLLLNSESKLYKTIIKNF